MPILRTIMCDICGRTETEIVFGNGFIGWGAFQGIKLDGIDNPSLCPEHKAMVADFIDDIKQKVKRNDVG